MKESVWIVYSYGPKDESVYMHSAFEQECEANRYMAKLINENNDERLYYVRMVPFMQD